MATRPDEGQERLVQEALARSPLMRGSSRVRAAKVAAFLILVWGMVALAGWWLATETNATLAVVFGALLGVVFLVVAVVAAARPDSFVRWSVLSMTSSDEDARRGFPGGGG